ncbi:MAG: N-acetylmuramoyl-L-alanine amidase [Firmicutes bacterium]|nr:N-acetylmuramoyl-L-alanine amidase [Bacillota bacterium]
MQKTVAYIRKNSELRGGNRPGIPLHPTGMVVHRTGDPGATARQIRGWFDQPHGRGRESSAHYVVDGREILLLIPEGEVAWHAGPQANHNMIGVETCEPLTPAAYHQTVQLVADICRRHGWEPTTEFIKPHSYFDPVNRPHDPFSWRLFEAGRQDPEALYDAKQFYADVAEAFRTKEG